MRNELLKGESQFAVFANQTFANDMVSTLRYSTESSAINKSDSCSVKILSPTSAVPDKAVLSKTI